MSAETTGAASAALFGELADRVAYTRRLCMNARAFLDATALASPSLDHAIELLDELLADLEAGR